MKKNHPDSQLSDFVLTNNHILLPREVAKALRAQEIAEEELQLQVQQEKLARQARNERLK